MKVLQITAAYKPAYVYGGPTMSVAELCEQLHTAGCDVQVFTTTANGINELDVPAGKPVLTAGIPVIYFKRLTKDHSHFSPALLKALWRDVKSYDLVHIHAWWNLVSVFSCLIARLRGVRVIVSPRGTLSSYSFQHRNGLFKRLMHQGLSLPLLKKCFIHTTSPQEEADLKRLTSFAGIFTLPNFVKLPHQSAIKTKSEQPYLHLLFYSRIDAKKGLKLLLQALPLLKIPYQLTIAGTGDEHYINELKQLTIVNQTNVHINWIGFQHENKFSLLEDHDLMVLPSYNENFGNVVVESLSAGTAVLISKYVGLADYITKNSLGWLCDTDPESIARQIQLIFQQADKLKVINQQAPELVHKDFTGRELAQLYMNQYQQVISIKHI